MKNQKLKKGLALFLTAALTLGVVPTLPGSAENIKAAESGAAQSVTEFATKEQLMKEFDLDGENDTIGKIVFGKNSSDSPVEWYIAGKDDGITTDNVILFAVEPLKTDIEFQNDMDGGVYSDEWECIYETNPQDVYANHYGASDLRIYDLKEIEEDYFSGEEKKLMNDTTVSTYDECNGRDYKTKDKVYALSGVSYHTASSADAKVIWAGSKNDVKIALAYWENSEKFWLRPPVGRGANYIGLAAGGDCVDAWDVSSTAAVRPAFNLNLSNVLFASAVPAATSTDHGKVYEDTAMTIRLDGKDNAIGDAVYNEEMIIAKNVKEVVSLVVQGDNWYYRTAIDGTKIIYTEDIESVVGADISFENCKIWIEKTNQNVTYANMATEGIHSIDKIALTGITAPTGGVAFDVEAECETNGITSKTPTVTYTQDGNSITTDKADWNKNYVASVTLDADIENYYVFSKEVSATVNNDSNFP